MSLKIRVLLVLLILFSCLTLLFLGLSYILAGKIMDSLDREHLQENIERVLRALDREVAAIDNSAQDWATWDETYDFVRDGNPKYIEKNLQDNAFSILYVNYIVLIDNSGRTVYARGFDYEAGTELPLPPEIYTAAPTPQGGRKGWLRTSLGPLLVSARPILKGDGRGPASGTLIFGRLLKDSQLQRLSETTLLPLRLRSIEDVDVSGLEPYGYLENGEAFYAEILSSEQILGSVVIRDLEGRAAAVLQVVCTRPAIKAFLSAKQGFSIFLVGAAFLFCALALLWLDRAIVSRLVRLNAAITSTHNPPALPYVPILEGRDEISLLSTEISNMLERLEHYQREVTEQEKKYRALIENAAEAVLVIQNSIITFVNQAAVKHTGYTTDELLFKPFLFFVYAEDRDNVLQHYQTLMEKKRPLYAYLFRLVAKDGSLRWVETNSVVIEWEGQPAILHFLTDITARKILEEELQRLMAEKSLILDSLTEFVVFLDRDLHVIWANRAASQAIGLKPEDLFGGRCFEIWHGRATPCPGCPVLRALETGEVCTGEIPNPGGRIWRITASPVKDKLGNITGAVETTLDITEHKRYEEQLKFLSLHDPLTGLYNRVFFQEELHRLSASREYPITILVADLDGLKLLNDTLGHDKGDEMLKSCANVLKNSLRRSDILARIGGDEFAAILPRTSDTAAQDIARRIMSAIALYNEQHPDLPMQLSIGYATCMRAEETLEETLKKADDLMYRHKLVHRSSTRNQIVGALLAALKEKDYITAGHAERLQDICLKMGERLGLSPRQLADLTLLAQVHDLGKVAIPDNILFKPGPLTEEEWQIMRQHSEKGYRIALASPDLAGVADLILKHHERWDGKGYPLGLKGEEIPIECRILAIADTYDAMTSERPYRKPKSKEEALREIRRCAGSQFDPKLVEVFISLFGTQELA